MTPIACLSIHFSWGFLKFFPIKVVVFFPLIQISGLRLEYRDCKAFTLWFFKYNRLINSIIQFEALKVRRQCWCFVSQWTSLYQSLKLGRNWTDSDYGWDSCEDLQTFTTLPFSSLYTLLLYRGRKHWVIDIQSILSHWELSNYSQQMADSLQPETLWVCWLWMHVFELQIVVYLFSSLPA